MNFYLVLRHDNGSVKNPAELETHLSWMRDQHQAGTVLVSGPSGDGALGVYVMRMPSHDEASMLAATDPLAGEGVRVEVIDWNVHQILGIGSFDASELGHGA